MYRCLYGNSGGFAGMCEAAFTLLTNPPGSVLGEHFNSYHITEKKTITVLQDVFVKNVPLSAYRKSVMMIRQFYRLSLRTAGRQVDRDIL